MKKCPICGDEIINGENGCAWYRECFKCKPIRYICKPMKPEESYTCTTPDYYDAIMARQEAWMD